jgi:large subunit ribosomal protein L4
MANLPVFNRQGQEVGRYEIDPALFAPEINKQLLHDVVVMYQRNQRLGTAKTKTRGEVAGSTKKMYRQKGTGNARAGGRRSGVRVGGGHIFAKRPRDWYFRLPKKAIRIATRMALASKIQSEQVLVLDELTLTGPKTKDMVAVLKAVGCEGQRVLVATAKHDPNVYLSARNIERVAVSPVSDLNALALLLPQKVVATRAALDELKARVEAEKVEKSED